MPKFLEDVSEIARLTYYRLRANRMRSMREEGLSDAEIGRRFGISRQRVGQILGPASAPEAPQHRQPPNVGDGVLPRESSRAQEV